MRRWLVILLTMTLVACGGGVTATTAVNPTTGSEDTGSAAVVSTTFPSTTSPAITTVTTTSSAPTHTPFWATVKYRADPVDLADPVFEHLDTSGSSVVGGAWYDAAHQYMVIRLQGTFYHYCRMPASAWGAFRAADSFGSYYNASIKGRYDCRSGGVPDY